jgi:hypothetical protein
MIESLALEQALDSYLEDYELTWEHDAGLSGSCGPTDIEKALIKDAIMGFIAVVGTPSKYLKGMTEEAVYTAWDGAGSPVPLDAFKSIVKATETHYEIGDSL